MRSMLIDDNSQSAYNVCGVSQNLRVYMQTKVLAGDDEPESFSLSLEAWRKNFSERRRVKGSANLGRFTELDDQEAELSQAVATKARSLFDRSEFTSADVKWLFEDYGWKISRLPTGIETILSIGCGRGAELVFLRALYPDAKITALDYTQHIRGGESLLKFLDIQFIEGDIFKNIETLEPGCGLIFSNHVIEHFYEPDEQIAALARLLNKGGIFAAGLPLDAYPFSDTLEKLAIAPESIHPLDMNLLDVRHPWKTNEPDLAATLLGAGLSNVEIYQRANHASRSLPLSIEECRERERKAKTLYSFTLGLIVGAIKSTFGEATPRRLARLIFAADRRLWFGRYRLKCDVQPEVFVTAVRLD